MERRKFMIGAGALATGTSAAVGTGAFSSASLGERTVAVDVAGDSNAQIGLVAGDVSDVSEKSNGEIELSLTGDGDGEGVNTNSVYEWGTGDDNYAFALQNNDDSTYEVVDFTYELNDASWLDDDYEYKVDGLMIITTMGMMGIREIQSHSLNLLFPFPLLLKPLISRESTLLVTTAQTQV